MLFPFIQKFLSMFTDLPACFSLLHCMYIFMIYALLLNGFPRLYFEFVLSYLWTRSHFYSSPY